MANAENTENTFIFTWKIGNFAYYVNEKISSPIIFAHPIDSEFRLELFVSQQQSGESVISFYLQLVHAHCQSIELDFELSLLSLDGSPLISRKTLKKRFSDGKCYGFWDFVPLHDVMCDKRTEFLPHGNLTLQCMIWNSEDKISESVLCCARTQMGIEQASFVWSIEKFSALTDNKTIPYPVRTASGDDPLLSMNFQLDEVLSEGKYFELEITPEKVLQIAREKAKEDTTEGEVGFYDFELSFINILGFEKLDQMKNRLECGKIHGLLVLITEEMLNGEETGYLVDDVLTLKCEFTFYKGIIFEEVERTVYGYGAISDLPNSQSVALYRDGMCTCISSLTDLQKYLYDTQMFCDVKLQTETECFSAHKNILSAKSPVFQSMFEEKGINDMIHTRDTKDRDKKEDTIEILDMNAETLRQMIRYIYTDTIDGEQLENIYQLFMAATKYKINILKEKCFAILEENLNIRNACEMLLFAAKNEEEDLKLFVRDFILEHGKEVTGLTAWKILEKRNPAIAEEIYPLV